MNAGELGLYLSIFAWLFFTGIGIPPVPEEAGILYAAGMSALHPEVRWPLAWLACGLGIVCADMVLYGVGRRWGPRMFEHRWVKWLIHEDRRQRIESKFQKHGIKLLLLARFLPPLRTGVFLIAGASRFSFAKFLTADLLYAVFGVGLFFLGGTWLIDLVRRAGHLAIYVVAGLAAAYGLYRYYRYLKARELRPDDAPPASVLDTPPAKELGA